MKPLAALAALGALAAALLLAAPAPSALGPYPSLGAKCGVFPKPGPNVPADAPSLPTQRAWNQDISNAPLDPRSGQIIDFINGDDEPVVHPGFGSSRAYGFPYAVVRKEASRRKVKFAAYDDQSDHGAYRIPLWAPLEGGHESDGDRHVLTYDRGRCKLYELYRAFPKLHSWGADSGVIWDLQKASLRRDGFTSADGAGLPIFPGLVRYDEVASGEIDHAIRVTFDTTRDAWIHPASHCAGATHNLNAPAMGTRLRLRADYDVSGLSGGALVIAEALKRYGLIVADNGSDWFLSGTSDPRWSDEDLSQLKAIPGSAFEVVASQAGPHVC
jgi:hypothetical protein